MNVDNASVKVKKDHIIVTYLERLQEAVWTSSGVQPAIVVEADKQEEEC